MNYSKKLIVTGLILLAAAWTVNVFYYNSRVLKEPLFLKHYYNINSGWSEFQLFYLQNINSAQNVVIISFPELNKQYVPFVETEWNSERIYYKMKNLRINMFNGKAEQIPADLKNKVITKAEVHFSDGKTMTVDLGKIYLYSDTPDKKETLNLKNSGSTSSSDNTGSASFIAGRDIKILGLSFRFNEIVGDALKFRINGQDYNDISLPMNIKANENVSIEYSFRLDKNDIRSSYVYSLPIEVLTEDSNGYREKSTFQIINYWQQHSKGYNIKELLKAQGRE
ncbi:hypothetical protein NBE98_05125 [Clostridium swellfunianum]|uniref:hypothetical protein n=1 Tax=Clostridium swellfunianum TaxID=1367462 RepID=UPI00202E4036|nr:hypothetical protein [Clostridium swellfunianum]MCM0647758.1 hypothetical protein [Clostridium swellfunianum]